MFIYGAIDDLYQKNARFLKLKLFFSMQIKYGIYYYDQESKWVATY